MQTISGLPEDFDDHNTSAEIRVHRDTNNLVVFDVDQETGRLSSTGEEPTLENPKCVLFAT